MPVRSISLLVFSSLLAAASMGQDTAKAKKAVLRDTLDNKLDFSHFIGDIKGFLPMAVLITEPALGSLGLAGAPLWLTPKKSSDPTKYVPPDVTVACAMYTANKSWGAGGIHIGSFPKAGIKYRFGAFYGDINIDFYHTIKEKEYTFDFNVRALPLFASISKRITKNDIYLGLKYVFMPVKLTPNFVDTIPSFIPDRDLDNNAAALGVFLDWDKRNSVFTADKGFRINTEYSVNDNWTGSDFEYQKLYAALNWFIPITKNWISGLRVEGQQIFEEPPFYLYPSIRMRGIPAARYQGAGTLLLETEQRYDFTLRWSAVAFAGIGQAVQKNQSFSDGKTVYSAGGGFRYLIARAFKFRAGVDVGFSPDSWGYYIVFGHNWNR